MLSTGRVQLPPEEAHHLVASLRVKMGDSVTLFDGVGHEGLGVLARVTRREVEAEVSELRSLPFDAPRRVTLAVALPKTHRQAFMMEKCTELGVFAFWPMVTEHSVVRPGDGTLAKLQRRCIEAAKQSGRAWVPEVVKPQTFDEVVRRSGEFERAVVTHPEAKATGLGSFSAWIPTNCRLLVCVGPEGGWSEKELQSAESAGFALTRLCSTTLRTETAAVAVCALALC